MSYLSITNFKNIVVYHITNFTGCAVWVRNLVSHFEGGT